jgi:hypothetical protein
VLGMLIEILSTDAVTGHISVTGQGEVSFVHLMRVTSDANLRAIAVERVVPRRCVRFAVGSTARSPTVCALSHGFLATQRKSMIVSSPR